MLALPRKKRVGPGPRRFKTILFVAAISQGRNKVSALPHEWNAEMDCLMTT